MPEPKEDEAAVRCAHRQAGGAFEQLADRLFRRGGKRRRYYSWAELMKRVFRTDVLVCTGCGGRRKVLTFLTDPAVIRRILRHLGLPRELPAVASARGPPLPFG